MASFPVMCFLTVLLLPSQLTEGWVLKWIQRDITIYADTSVLLIKCDDIEEAVNYVIEILLDNNEDEIVFKEIPNDIQCI